VLQTHVRAAGKQRGRILRPVRHTGAAVIKHEALVHNFVVRVAVLLQAIKEMRQLLVPKQIALRAIRSTRSRYVTPDFSLNYE
jgi:hypothetical protein